MRNHQSSCLWGGGIKLATLMHHLFVEANVVKYLYACQVGVEKIYSKVAFLKNIYLIERAIKSTLFHQNITKAQR